MNQWMLRNGVDISQSRNGGPNPAANGRCLGELTSKRSRETRESEKETGEEGGRVWRRDLQR